jgi:hypothetical protein
MGYDNLCGATTGPPQFSTASFVLSSVFYFTLALTGKTRFGWAITTSFSPAVFQNIILYSGVLTQFQIPRSNSILDGRVIWGPLLFSSTSESPRGIFLTLCCLHMLFFFNWTLAVLSFPPHYRRRSFKIFMLGYGYTDTNC